MDKEWLNLDDLSKYLGLAKVSIYKLTSAKKIPYYRPTGGHIMFRKSEIDKWVESSKQC